MESITVTLLGSSFSIKIDKDKEYFKKVMTCFEDKVQYIEKNLHITKDPLKVSILAGLLIADDYINLVETGDESLNAFTSSLIKKIDDTIARSE